MYLRSLGKTNPFDPSFAAPWSSMRYTLVKGERRWKASALLLEEDHSSVTLCATGAQLKCKAVGGSPLQRTQPSPAYHQISAGRPVSGPHHYSPSCWETCFSYPAAPHESWLTSSYSLGLPAFLDISLNTWRLLGYLKKLMSLLQDECPPCHIFAPSLPCPSQSSFHHSEGRHLKGFHPLLHHSTGVLFATQPGCWEAAVQEVGGRITVKIFALRVCAMLKRDNNNKGTG